jgi:hypothetical protein
VAFQRAGVISVSGSVSIAPGSTVGLTAGTSVAVNNTVSTTVSNSVSTTISGTVTTAVTGTVAVTGSVTVTGTTVVSGAVTVTGTTTVTGAVTVTSGTVAISGPVTVTGAVTVSGTTTISGAVTVTSGTVAISGTVAVSGTVAITGTTVVSGAVTVTGSVAVTGTTTITGSVTVASGSISISSITAGTIDLTATTQNGIAVQIQTLGSPPIDSPAVLLSASVIASLGASAVLATNAYNSITVFFYGTADTQLTLVWATTPSGPTRGDTWQESFTAPPSGAYLRIPCKGASLVVQNQSPGSMTVNVTASYRTVPANEYVSLASSASTGTLSGGYADGFDGWKLTIPASPTVATALLSTQRGLGQLSVVIPVTASAVEITIKVLDENSGIPIYESVVQTSTLVPVTVNAPLCLPSRPVQLTLANSGGSFIPLTTAAITYLST